MSNHRPQVDYRAFRFRKLNTDEFRHLKLLLYWPVFGLLFFCAERLWPAASHHVMACPLDDLIPFCELFLIPYLFWFIFLAGMHLYTLLFDLHAFRRMMKFIIFTYSVALLIYFVFPSCQHLRPAIFPRDNPLTRFIAGFYRFDTNTNCFPSLHVVGSFAVFFASRDIPRFRRGGWNLFFCAATFFISISTVFVKQHSVLDLAAALLLCLAARFFTLRSPETFGRRSAFTLRT